MTKSTSITRSNLHSRVKTTALYKVRCYKNSLYFLFFIFTKKWCQCICNLNFKKTHQSLYQWIFIFFEVLGIFNIIRKMALINVRKRWDVMQNIWLKKRTSLSIFRNISQLLVLGVMISKCTCINIYKYSFLNCNYFFLKQCNFIQYLDTIIQK